MTVSMGEEGFLTTICGINLCKIGIKVIGALRELDRCLQRGRDVRLAESQRGLLACRIEFFFDIIRNERMYRRFGYCSMGRFLFGSIWTHFFDKKIEEV